MQLGAKIETTARFMVFIAGVLSVVSLADVATGGKNGYTVEHVIGFPVFGAAAFFLGKFGKKWVGFFGGK
jgi:hypothetical protein